MLLAAEYVICLGCKSPDTILSKENRLFFLRCEKVYSFYLFIYLVLMHVFCLLSAQLSNQISSWGNEKAYMCHCLLLILITSQKNCRLLVLFNSTVRHDHIVEVWSLVNYIPKELLLDKLTRRHTYAVVNRISLM